MFPRDALNVKANIMGNGTTTLVASLPTDTTILYGSYNTNSTDLSSSLNVSCGSVVLLRVNSLKLTSNIERFVEAICPSGSNLLASVSGTVGSPITTVSLIYVLRDRRVTIDPILSTTTPDITYHDWLFVSQVQIFLLSFMIIGLLFSISKKGR